MLLALRGAAGHMKAGGEAAIRFYRPDEGGEEEEIATPPEGFQ